MPRDIVMAQSNVLLLLDFLELDQWAVGAVGLPQPSPG